VIATNDCIYVDECDPLFDIVETFTSWSQVKRRVGRNLNRALHGDHIVISSAEDYPDYREIKGELTEACRSVNANNRVSVPDQHRDLAARAG
jgi:hypothetical protein